MPKSLTVRQYTANDANALIDIQRQCFPPPYPQQQLWSPEQIASHVAHFPEGAMCIAVSDGALVASCTSLMLSYKPSEPMHSWSEATDDGFLATHDPRGNILYGVDIAVSPKWRGKGIARMLYNARYELVRKKGLDCFMAVSRIPGYHLHKTEMSAEAYVKEVVSGKLLDPVVTPQLRVGLVSGELVPDYIPDEESQNYALVMRWMNPDIKSGSKK